MKLQLLRRPDVEKATGLSRASVYRLVATNRFPQPVEIIPGGRAVGWWRHEVEEWLKRRPRTRVGNE